MTSDNILLFVDQFKTWEPKHQKNFIKVLVQTHYETHKIAVKASEDRALQIIQPLGFKIKVRSQYSSKVEFKGMEFTLDKTVKGFSLNHFVAYKTASGNTSHKKIRCTVLFAKQTNEKIAKRISKYMKEIESAYVIES